MRDIQNIISASVPPPDFEFDSSNGMGLRKGYGSATYSRTTTGTVIDHEGLVRNCKSGEIRMHGYRRVENLVSSISGAGWANSGILNTSLEFLSTSVTSNNTTRLSIDTLSASVGAICAFRFKMKAGNVDNIGKSARLLAYNAGSAGNTQANIVLTSDYQIITITTPANTTAGPFSLWLFGSTTNTASAITVTDIQAENILGQSVQYPADYVSNGALSAPYHGYGVDGVKYFDTKNGNTVADNIVTEAQGLPIEPSVLRGYLPEGQRQNKQRYSYNPADTTGWTAAGDVSAVFSVVDDSATLGIARLFGPNVYKLDNSAGSAGAYVYRSDSVTGNTNVHSLSVYVRGGTGKTSIGSAAGIADFSASASYTRIKNENITPGSAAQSFSIHADAGQTVYFTMFQAEEGAFISSHIPTTSAAVTRNADLLNYPAINNINLSEGTMLVEFQTETKYSGIVLSHETTALRNSIAIFANTGTNNPLVCRFRIQDAGGTISADIQTTGVASHQDSRIYKYVGVWDKNSANNGINGKAGVADYSISLPSAYGNIHIGYWLNGGAELYGYIRRVRIWRRKLSERQLMELTR